MIVYIESLTNTPTSRLPADPVRGSKFSRVQDKKKKTTQKSVVFLHTSNEILKGNQENYFGYISVNLYSFDLTPVALESLFSFWSKRCA